MSCAKQAAVTSSAMAQGRRSLTPSFVRSRRSHLIYRGTPVPLKGLSPSPALSATPSTPDDPLGDLTLAFEQKCHVTSTPGCERVTVRGGRTSRRQRSTPTIAENDVDSKDEVGGGESKHHQQNSAASDERIVCKFKDSRTLKQMRFASLPVNCHLVHDIFSGDTKSSMSSRGAAGDPGPCLGTPTTEPVLHLSQLPTPNTTTLLIVGLDSSPCEPISRALLGRALRGQLQIRRTSTLPLTKDTTRPRVDFVLFVAELASPHSVHLLRQALRHVQVPFFLGKSCLLLLHTATSKSRVDLETVLRLGDAYNLPQFKVNIDNEREVEVFADQLLKMTQTAAGLVPQINTLLLETTKQTYQWDNNAL